jgi:hypothetical protein
MTKVSPILAQPTTNNYLPTTHSAPSALLRVQIVRRTDELLGKERKSMRDIMASLVVKAYGEWDQAARRLVDVRLIAAAVRAGVGSHPGELVLRLLLLL